MHHYGKIVNRTKGVGMDFIKFHMAICHIVSEFFDNGVPANINTEPVESHHKFNGVAPSETTQHRADDFELQTCYQYLERLCIARAFESLPESKKPNKEVKAPTTGGAEFAIKVTKGPEGELSFAEFRWKSKDNHSRYQARHINWIADNIVANLPYPAIAGFTEQIRETFLFRTHPQFRSIDPWQDWAMIRWDSTLTPTPGKLICFIDLTDGLTDNEEGLTIDGITHTDPGLYVVVESLTGPPIPVFGVLSMVYQGTKSLPNGSNGRSDEGKLFLIPADSIVGPVAVVPDIGGNPGDYLVIAPVERWDRCFTSFIQPRPR